MNAIAEKCRKVDPTDPTQGQSDTIVQLVIALALGLSAFIGFCFLRPRWKGLYAARKQQRDSADSLPVLPDTLFGWIPVLYKVTEQQVLASAGLDAFVFLSFFKMSIKLFSVMFFFALVVMAPINKRFRYLPPWGDGGDQEPTIAWYNHPQLTNMSWSNEADNDDGSKKFILPEISYLWAYFVFTYVFTALSLYFMTNYTRRIIRIRQDYLGSQTTITDRTIKLSGIPPELQSEEKIKELLEKLEIGKVENVTICRDWKKLDDMMDKRASILRRLEEAWTVHLGNQASVANAQSRVIRRSSEDYEEDESNAHESGNLLGQSHVTPYEQPRPTTKVWYGFLNLTSKKVDAIDYYEEQLRKLDDKIIEARKQQYKPTRLAFVTMDSIPACQMAVQALLDPSPMQLLAKLAPAPSDIVWPNTYQPRSSRMIRSWTVSIFIFVLTLVWLAPVGGLAGLLNLCSIQQVWPEFAKLLERHEITKALVQTGLPTLVVSLLNVAVPFLYDYLANMQGSISQGDVELSLISKNFFFTFFNVFLVFTAFGAAGKFWPALQESLKDTTKLAYRLAESIDALAIFYTNFILLQGVGLMPFRLLEFGSVALYPIMLIGAKTPRDYAELVQPPIFKYGFYLPTAILVYILCFVYSILPAGYMVLFFGLIYFVLGYFIYKYQLLYAMDHPQHATGGAWPMICHRILVGLGVFQLLMAGYIALHKSFVAATLIVPLIPLTIWYSYFYARTFEPLMKFIALRSIRRENNADFNIVDEDIGAERPAEHIRRESTTVDESREKGQKFVNPSLFVPLEKIWINGQKGSNDDSTNRGAQSPDPLGRQASTESSVSLGDTHIWRENGDNNV
ncbi:DUF221-domain-containing protein [Coleophoma crateriformis]|uniref:DUF221-domain-containing protein n=1 Tax=Coleophoma crateriformis TaxID=565419 RepID=A0A3D8QQW1_9HELO|nr:DUF221-domain-containing protein [Coleophoma crateriformis]